MFKNVKKALFAFVLLFVALFAIACGKKEANNENCKEFCDECPTCNNASAETCKDFCPSAPECKEASAETCKKFQDFVAPTSFSVSDNELFVGGSAEVWIDDEAWEPENCDKTLVFVSDDPEIATVDADGVVYGHRPGTVSIKVYSPLNPDLEEEVEFEVKDAEKNDQKVVDRELAAILAQLPAFITEDTELPEAWNTFVNVTYKVAGAEIDALEVPANLTEDTVLKVAVQLTLNDAVATDSKDVWAVLDENVNTYVVVESAAALLNNYMAKYVKGEKVAADLDLLPSVFGCTINWSTTNANAIAADGKYNAQSEDKAVVLTAGIRYGAKGSKNIDFNLTAKGYTAAEKADEIMASTFGMMEGKEFNTSIVLPEFDDKFGAKLSYKSLDAAVYGDNGILVAAVTEAKDVKFKVTIEYSIAGNAAENFIAEKELTIKAVPANAASTALEALLTAHPEYQKVVYAPWGKKAGNLVFPELDGMVWDVAATKLDARLQDDYQVFSQAADGAALKLDAQYLRYQLVSVQGTYTKDGTSANVVLFFNIGISKTPHNIISGIWRSSAQKDTSLSEIQGKYDLAGNVSYFDKKIGNVTETYGSGYFSGWSVTAERDLGASLTLSKVPGSTDDPAWKCAVAEKIEGADYTGINKLLVTVTGPKDEQLLIKTNDSKEDWVKMTGETLELSIDLAITFDTNKFPMVLFCNPGEEGTGHEFVITKMQLTGTDKVIDLLNGTSWRSLDAGVYNVKYSDGKELWQTFMMEVMTVYIREKDGKVYIDPANVNGGIAGAGGNWGVWYVNTTDKPVNIEVGVYGDATLKYKEGHATSSAIGSRLNIAMDGYALGFVADSTGKIINGSNNSKLQNGMPDKRAVLGGKTYKAGDKVSEAMYNAMQLDGKAEKFEAVYTAADNLLFVVSETGTFKKDTAEDGTVSYVPIAAGETVEEKYAPTYAKGAVITAEQYATLDDAAKALVTVEYKAKEAVTYEVANLFGDSANGAIVNYLTIPANGYAMSWKYQFYGVGVASTVYAFCQEGETLNIEHFQVHPLSSMDAEYATNYVVAAEEFTSKSDDVTPSTIFTASTNVLFVQNNEGKYKAETKDEKTSYVLIKEDEVVAEANRFAPTYVSGDILTTAQYNALSADDKKLISLSYYESNVIAARGRYSKLTGDTLADVFPEARLISVETVAAALLDNDIAKLLASEPAADADKAQFAKDLAIMWNRLYKTVKDEETEEDKVVDKITPEIKALMTKKADFDTKYAEYAAIDLHITYDYDGGYIQGFWKDTDKKTFLETEFLPDLYAFMLAKGAWEEGSAPTLETFLTTEYWTTNYSKNEATALSAHLFTPKVEKVGEEFVTHENYHDVIADTDKFFNSAEGHKYIALMDYVDESTRSGNMGGQDAWGRKGDPYAAMEWLQRQSYYSTLSAAEQTKDLTSYGGNPVTVTNSGAVLGAYRFAQWVCGTGSASYKNWMPNNVWSNVFDRQYTQEHSVQIYHCTDLTVKLQDDPYKQGYTFLGWKFADGKDAVVTGSMFADVTVYAAWAPALEELIEEDLGVQLEGVFYGPNTDNNQYKKATDPGTLIDQVKTVGIGDYAFIVGTKLFVMPKFAAIELGKDATADVELSTKASVQVYGTDGSDQFSCGLVMGETTATPTNSYGHGALYHNAGEFKVTITEVKNTYGRNLDGAAYGYQRFLFHFDAEKQLYVGTKVSSADGTSVVLEPGDFLWCPETADRFCSGLTNCDGTSGVEGVWKGVENPEVKIISTRKYLPESPAWYTVKFLNEDGTIAKVYYDVKDVDVVAPTLEKKYYEFLGWAETADATEAATVDAKISRNVTYYPVFRKLDLFDEITVDPSTDGSVDGTFATLAQALEKSMDNAVITVLAGTYDEVLVINRPVKIYGPNKDVKGYRERSAEALFTGSISVAEGVNGLVINGMAFGGDDSKYLEEAYTGNSNKCKILFNGSNNDFVFTCNYVTAGRVFLELGASERITISNNFFNWTAETAQAYSYWRPIRVDKPTVDFSFVGNKVVQTVAGDGSTGFYDTIYLGNAKGTTTIQDNIITFKCYNWAFNIAAGGGTFNVINNIIEGADTGDDAVHGAGFAIEGTAAETVINIIGNKFVRVAGTTFSAKTAATVNVKYNSFEQAVYKPRLNTNSTITHEKNYVKAGSVTSANTSSATYAAVTLDNDYTDAAAYAAAAKTLSGTGKVTKFATGYVNGTEFYLSKGYAFNAWYIRRLAIKYLDTTDQFVVVGTYNTDMVKGVDFDFILALHDSYTGDDKAALKTLIEGAQAGDIVVFEGKTFADLQAYASSTAVEINVSIYANNAK